MPDSLAANVASEVLGQAVLGIDAASPTFSRRQRFTLWTVVLLTYVLTALLARSLGFWQTTGFGGSLLLDGNPIIYLTAGLFWLAIIFATAAFAGKTVRPDIGVFAVAIAFFAIRRAGGAASDTYLQHPTGRTFGVLLGDLAILTAILVAGHVATRALVRRGTLSDDADLDGVRPEPEPTSQKVLATATHALVTAVFLLVTLFRDDPMQVTGLVAVAAFLASVCTVRFVPATPAIIFWLGPILAGALGYAVTALGGTAWLSIGEPTGYCAALARAMPLDYASAGVAASIFGYWVGRGWIPEESLEKPKRAPAK